MAIKYLVEGLIPEGVTLLTGPGMSGKSLFALQVAVAKSNGTDVLGKPVSKGHVVYMNLKDDIKRIDRWRQAHELITSTRFHDDVELDQVRKGIKSYPDHALIVDELVHVDLSGNGATLLAELDEFYKSHPLFCLQI